MSNPARTEEDITTGLMAMVAWAGNSRAAADALKAEGKLNINAATLYSWARERFADRYEELREKYAEQLEKQLINDMRDIVGLALAGERLAIQRAVERLEAGEDKDPARTAANLSSVAKSSTDKMLSLSGRPTNITENRDASEIMRALISRHPQLFKLDAPEIVEGTEPPMSHADSE